MSDAQQEGAVPVFETRHRMALALEHADVSVSEMADYLAVNRNTVGNWLAGRAHPRDAYLRVWAMRCGLPYRWIRYGEAPPYTGPERRSERSTRYNGPERRSHQEIPGSWCTPQSLKPAA